jgi:hypothetical protein
MCVFQNDIAVVVVKTKQKKGPTLAIWNWKDGTQQQIYDLKKEVSIVQLEIDHVRNSPFLLLFVVHCSQHHHYHFVSPSQCVLFQLFTKVGVKKKLSINT